MASRFGLFLVLLFTASIQAPAQQDQKVPDMTFQVGMTTQGMPGVYHVLQFSSAQGNCEMIEITIGELLFNVEHLTTMEGEIQVSKGFAKDEYVVKYLSPQNATKFFVFTYDPEHHLKSIKGSATTLERMPGQEESKVSVEAYVEMKSEERHFIPVTLKTLLPGIYPWDTKVSK